MSIFVEFVTFHIKQEIVAAREASLARDQSPVSRLRNFFGCPRDLGLSEEKRTHLAHLQSSLDSFSSTSPNYDDQARAQLQTLLTQCIINIKDSSAKRKKPEGETDKAIQKIPPLIEFIYAKFATLQLLKTEAQEIVDQQLVEKDALGQKGPLPPKAKEALHIFQYHVGQYYAKKITASRAQGSTEQMVAALVTSLADYTQKMDDPIKSTLEKCKEDLTDYRLDNPKYAIKVNDCVAHHIEALKRIDTEYRTNLGITVATLEWSGAFTLETLLLSHCMNEALTELVLLKMPPEPTAPEEVDGELTSQRTLA